MGSEVARRSSSNGLARAVHVDAGRSDDIDQATFTATAAHFAGMPTAFRTPAAPSQDLAVIARPRGGAVELARKMTGRSEAKKADGLRSVVIASGARIEPGARRRGERLVQRQTGWNATPTGIVVVTAERDLARRSDGRLAPEGPWLLEQRITHPCLDGVAEKREGKVPFDDASRDEPEPAARPAGAGGAEPSFSEGRQALAFLPQSVRRSVLARVAAPTLFDGHVLQYAGADQVALRQEVSLLRMDDAAAVVVHAVRPTGAREWTVTQAVYRLGGARVEQH